jgi:hypothetical protein
LPPDGSHHKSGFHDRPAEVQRPRACCLFQGLALGANGMSPAFCLAQFSPRVLQDDLRSAGGRGALGTSSHRPAYLLLSFDESTTKQTNQLNCENATPYTTLHSRSSSSRSSRNVHFPRPGLHKSGQHFKPTRVAASSSMTSTKYLRLDYRSRRSTTGEAAPDDLTVQAHLCGFFTGPAARRSVAVTHSCHGGINATNVEPWSRVWSLCLCHGVRTEEVRSFSRPTVNLRLALTAPLPSVRRRAFMLAGCR